MAMTSGRLAAETIIEAFDKGDFSRNVLTGYISRLHNSYIMNDLKKYRRFNTFRLQHHELFTILPGLASFAAQEMLTVDGVPKKEKQKAIWKKVRKEMSLVKILHLLWDGWRSVK